MYKKYDKVSLKNCNLKGTIIKCINKKNNNIYQIRLDNNFLIYVNEDEILGPYDTIKNKYINTKFEDTKITYEIKSKRNEFIEEIMIRHQTLEEAIQNVDYFINQAVLLNIKKIKIIHGKNGGILRRGVHDYLKKNKFVNNFYLGEYFEGSYGVTIVILKGL